MRWTKGSAIWALLIPDRARHNSHFNTECVLALSIYVEFSFYRNRHKTCSPNIHLRFYVRVIHQSSCWQSAIVCNVLSLFQLWIGDIIKCLWHLTNINHAQIELCISLFGAQLKWAAFYKCWAFRIGFISDAFDSLAHILGAPFISERKCSLEACESTNPRLFGILIVCRIDFVWLKHYQLNSIGATKSMTL